jgi:hypothetical protein
MGHVTDGTRRELWVVEESVDESLMEVLFGLVQQLHCSCWRGGISLDSTAGVTGLDIEKELRLPLKSFKN